MAVRRRGSSWQADVRGPDRTRYRKAFRTEEEALAWEQSTREDLQRGFLPRMRRSKSKSGKSATCWTLRRAAEETYRLHWEDLPVGHQNRRHIEQLYEFFGSDLPVNRIKTDDVDSLVVHLRGLGNANGTINRKLACLSKILTEAEVKGHVERKPRIPRQREPEGQVRWLTEPEEQTLLDLLRLWEAHDQADAVTVLIDTGMRPSELWALLGQHVDFQERYLTVWRSKNRQPRSIPMTGRVTEILSRRIRGKPQGLRAFPFDNDWLIYHWNRARTVMGMADDPRFTPYVCRHTCATRLVKGGVPLGVIQKWLGHKTIQMTLRYAHLSPTDLMKAVPVLEGTSPGASAGSERSEPRTSGCKAYSRGKRFCGKFSTGNPSRRN